MSSPSEPAHDERTFGAEVDLARLTRQAAEPAPHTDLPLLPPRATHEGTLRRIYEVALVQFGERGYSAVSVRDITRAVGVQASSLYAHVKSKEQLLSELIRMGHEEHNDRLRQALLESGSDPREQVDALMRAHVLMHTTYPLLARVCNRELASLSEGSREKTLAIRLDSERMFFDVIRRGQQLGVFAPVEPVLAVAAIGAMAIRVAEWWTPDLGLTPDVVAGTYAEFAAKLLG